MQRSMKSITCLVSASEFCRLSAFSKKGCPVDIQQERAYVPVVCQKERLMTPPRGEVLQGTLDLIVLQTLHAMGPLHGYGIAQRVQQVSEDLLRLNQGTLYPALLRLEQRGWITSKWGASE